MRRLAVALAALGLVAGCGEKPQTTNAAIKKTDAQAFHGADNAYVASGWKAGDKTSWEEQMRARLKGQNEYNRIAAK